MPEPRRTFLNRLTALGAALIGVAAVPEVSRAQSAKPESEPADAWLDDFKGRHKNLYDGTTPEHGGEGWTFARNFLVANTGPIYNLKDEDLNIIVSVRHLATQFGFSDPMWEKYKLGDLTKTNDGGSPATRNPHATEANTLAKRGVIVTVCGLATGRLAGQIATRDALKKEDVEADLRANLVTPTARVVAAGVVITNRAQEKGFTYCYVG
jgi:intracellular sulfur oxidation DsrE/DsrF family protein